MAELSISTNKPDFAEKVNKAHEMYLQKLDAPDSDFPYWLSSAALNLCLQFKDVELRVKLKHVDELVKALKKGFEQKDLLHGLSEEETDRITYSKARFRKILKDKLDEMKTVDTSIASVSKESEEEVVQETMTVKETKIMIGGKEEVECVICRQNYKRPKILPCSHIVCMHCLEEIGRRTNKNPGDMMPCERCGQEFKISEEGFDGLENFEAVAKVIEPEQVLDPSSTCNTCQACAEDSDLDDSSEIPAAVIYCADCEQKLCAECRRYHKKNKQLKMHKMQGLEDPKNVPEAFAQLSIKSKTEDHLPLSDARHNRLEKIRPKIAHVIRSDSEVIAELRSLNAISRTDDNEIRAEKDEYVKSSKLISAIMRRSNQSYDSFQEVLRKTLQTVAAEFLYEGEMPVVHLNNNRPDLDGPLSRAFNETIRSNSECNTDIKELLTEMNGYGLNLVKAIPGQSIVIFIYCKTVQSAVKFTQLFNSGILQYLLDRILSRLLLAIEPHNTKELNSFISLEDEDIANLEEFTGIEGWKAKRVNRLKSFDKIYGRDAITQRDRDLLKQQLTGSNKECLDLKEKLKQEVKRKESLIEIQEIRQKQIQEIHQEQIDTLLKEVKRLSARGIQEEKHQHREIQGLEKYRAEFLGQQYMHQHERSKQKQLESVGYEQLASENSRIILQNYHWLAKSMDPDSGLLTLLFKRQVLTTREYDQIRSFRDRFKENEMLLSIMVRKTSEDFKEFQNALIKTRQFDIVEKMAFADREIQRFLLPPGEYHRTKNLNELPMKCLQTIVLKASALHKGPRIQLQNLASVCAKWMRIMLSHLFIDRPLLSVEKSTELLKVESASPNMGKIIERRTHDIKAYVNIPYKWDKVEPVRMRLRTKPSPLDDKKLEFPDSSLEMSHAEAIHRNSDILLRCTTINLYVIDFLRAKDVLDEAQESDLRAERSHLRQRILLFQWLKVVPSHRYESFLQVMKDAEQEHVANLLTGSTEEDHLPLFDARYTRLVKSRQQLASIMCIDKEMIAELRSSKAISKTDVEEIRAETVDYAKTSKLISAIMRRSNYSYKCFQEVLRKTLQMAAADFLSEGEMIAVHVKSHRPDLDEPLSLAFKDVEKNKKPDDVDKHLLAKIWNMTTDDAEIKDLLAEMGEFGSNPAKAKLGQNI